MASGRSYPEVLDAVARAIYGSVVQRATKHVDSIEFDCDSFGEIFLRIKSDSQTGQILIFGSIIEEKISTLIMSRMINVRSKRDKEILFGSHGPLSTFSSQINVAYYLGWLSEGTRAKLDSFRKLRNEFAHNAYRAQVDRDPIRSHIGILTGGLDQFLTTIFSSFDESDRKKFISDYSDLNDTQKLLCSFIFTCYVSINDLLVLPSAIAFNVNPNDIIKDYSLLPKNILKLHRCISTSILEILEEQPPTMRPSLAAVGDN